MMYMPSLFRENLVDDFFNDFDHSFFTRPVRGKEAVSVMKTDVRETKEGFELDVELPGYKKDSITLAPAGEEEKPQAQEPVKNQ